MERGSEWARPLYALTLDRYRVAAGKPQRWLGGRRMALHNRIFQFIYRQLLDRPAKNKSFDELINALESNGQLLIARVADKPDTPQNREQLRHIIGIERWGQRRLQTLLGQPYVQDEYDGYCPDESCDMGALRDALVQTRADSIAISARVAATRHCQDRNRPPERCRRGHRWRMAALFCPARCQRKQPHRVAHAALGPRIRARP